MQGRRVGEDGSRGVPAVGVGTVRSGGRNRSDCRSSIRRFDLFSRLSGRGNRDRCEPNRCRLRLHQIRSCDGSVSPLSSSSMASRAMRRITSGFSSKRLFQASSSASDARIWDAIAPAHLEAERRPSPGPSPGARTCSHVISGQGPVRFAYRRAQDTIVLMAEFASLHSYWDFEQGVKARAGSVREDTELLQGERDEGTKEFLRVVRETSRRRMRKVAKDRTFFRAQRGFTWTTVPLMGEDGRQIEVRDVAAAHPPERMVPLAEKVGAGRASRKGIPCLYLDNRESAAMSEMRPWVGSYITLAQFKMARDCLVVDCSLSTTASHLLEPFSLDEGEPSVSASTKEDGVWGSIGFAFARPVRLDDPRLDYISPSAGRGVSELRLSRHRL
jgi:hypothetical protein